MKRILSILYTLALLSFTACEKDFLEEELYSDFAPSALTDELGFDAALIGLQNQYAGWHTYIGNQGWLGVWQIGTDIAFNKAPADNDPWMVPYTDYGNLNSTDPAALFTWRWCYKLINNANAIIQSIENPALTIPAATKSRINGEARFYRALAYNTLVTLFGPVPLIEQPVDGPKTDFVRANLADLNALIEEDLLFGVNNLPSVENVPANNKGKMYSRAHKAMASHLLTEVYLRLGRFAEAEAQSNLVINSGDFRLMDQRFGIKASQPGDPFADMFIYGNQRRGQGNREAIWVLEFEDPNSVIGGTGSNLPPNTIGAFGFPQHRRMWVSRYFQQPGMLLADSLGGRGISRLALTSWVLKDLYEANDMRNSQFNIRRKFYYNNPANPRFGQLVDINEPGVDTNRFIVPYTTKWNQFNPNDPFGAAMIKDIIIMRLAETYLFKAEAQLRQGKADAAAETLNVLRTRANATPVTAAQVNLDFLLDERARELLTEENRRMTLMRTGSLLQRVPGRGQKVSGLAEKHLLLPIPQTEIDLNKDAVLSQNPGY